MGAGGALVRTRCCCWAVVRTPGWPAVVVIHVLLVLAKREATSIGSCCVATSIGSCCKGSNGGPKRVHGRLRWPGPRAALLTAGQALKSWGEQRCGMAWGVGIACYRCCKPLREPRLYSLPFRVPQRGQTYRRY